MFFSDKIKEVQQELKKQKFDGWLLYDFRRNNDLAHAFLKIPDTVFLTRRFAYWIPAEGEPIQIVHKIEPSVLNEWPGKKRVYASWQEFEGCIDQALRDKKRVAMEYSPRNALPYVSKVDGGTIDLVRSFGVEVVSSADLLQQYTAVWNQQQWDSHLKAAEVLDKTASGAWTFIAKSLQLGKNIREYDVQQYILEQFERNNCSTDSLPICGVNAHSADPHYSPSSRESSLIRKGDFILIDLWCKEKQSRGVYADITRVAIADSNPTIKQQEIFSIVRKAQQKATDFVVEAFKKGKAIRGWEVDQTCREIIQAAGYGAYFIHRTGHNIGIQDHGNGANIDNLETHDERLLLPGTCFSIEPGIYLPGEFGVRLEYDVFIHFDGQVQVTGGIQDKIVCLS